MSLNNFDQIHINLYNEILYGKYNPCQERNNKPEILRDLVIEANTIKVISLPASELTSEFIKNTDFLAYGFKKKNDYNIEIKHCNNGENEIIIKPLKTYDLLEAIDIPQFDSYKCNSYLNFFCDEFERIKVRAERIFEHTSESKIIEAYALRNIQKTKKVFHDAKRVLREVQKSDNPEDIYIFFVLNLFIVRTIIFYQKMFKPYLGSQVNSEELLFHEVMQELSLKKLCTLFPCCKSGFCEYIKKSFTEKAKETECLVNEQPVKYGETFINEKSKPAIKRTETYERIKLNGQINVLVDVFVQMLEDIDVPDGKFLETSRQNLKDFLLANFVDKNNKAFSTYTIDTILKPYRTDKHIKKGSPRRIDVSKRITKK